METSAYGGSSQRGTISGVISPSPHNLVSILSPSSASTEPNRKAQAHTLGKNGAQHKESVF